MLILTHFLSPKPKIQHSNQRSFSSFHAPFEIVLSSTGPSRFLAMMHVHLQASFAALERVFTLFELIPEDEQDEQKRKVAVLKGNIEFQRVAFSYDHQKPILKNISLAVNQCEKIAFVGPTGAAKSTLVNLIFRIYQPQSGEILFDACDATELNLRSLRARPRIHHSTGGRHQTKVGERGVKLSTGQKQRISIARALLKNPEETARSSRALPSRMIQSCPYSRLFFSVTILPT